MVRVVAGLARRAGRALRSQAGMGLAEVLVAAIVVGIAGVGTMMMFGVGQTSVQAEGQNRIALTLAEQRMEQVRSGGFGATSLPDPREETGWVTLDTAAYSTAGPGYQRTTIITGVCPRDFTLADSAGGCPPVSVTEAKRVVVTVRAVSSAGVPDDQTAPVVLQTVLLRR